MNKNFLSYRVKQIVSPDCGLINLKLLLTKALKEKERGVKFIDCSLGEPSFSLRLTVKRAGKTAIENDENGYTKPFFGLKSLRKALSLSFKKEGIKVTPERIVVTAGVGAAIDLFFRAVLNPGDEVIIPDPFYPPFVIHTLTYQGRPVLIDTYQTGFIPKLSLVAKKITKKTKVIVINSPNNPTGVVYPVKILKEIVNLARKFNLLILADEVYADFVYEGRFSSLIKLDPEKTIILRSFSKKYGMMGYKVGYTIGPRDVIEGMKAIMTPTESGPRISEVMATEAVKYSLAKKEFFNLKRTRDFLYENLKKYYPDLIKPRGAFYFYIKAPKGDAWQFSLDLLKKGVLVAPAFSKKTTHFRVAYAGLKKEELIRLVEVLKEASF